MKTSAVTHDYALIDSIRRELPRATNSTDSLRMLYDIFDLSLGDSIKPIATEIYELGRRTGNYDVQLDMIRNLVGPYLRNDSAIEKMYEAAYEMPVSNDRDETLVFITLNRVSLQARSSSEKQRQDELRNLIGIYTLSMDSDSITIYDKVRRLYTMCMYLSVASQTDLFIQYMDELGKLIESLPPSKSNALSNMYYVQLAIGSFENDEYVRTISANRNILGIIRTLKKQYASKGRPFRNYLVQEYFTNLRMLGCFPALNLSDVRTTYQRVLDLADRSPQIKMHIENTQLPHIYYYMATKQYKEALPLLKKQVDNPENKRYRRKLLKYLSEAAYETGDFNTFAEASKEYTGMLEEYIELKAAQKYRELQVIYDFADITSENTKLVRDKHKSELEANRRTIIFTLIALGILVLLFIVIFRMYLHARHLARHLQKSQETLQKEKERLLRTQQELILARAQAENANLIKTHFFQNITHEIRTPLNAIVGFSQLIADSVPAEKQKELDKYMRIINSNNELLTILVNDVLDITQLDSGEMRVSIEQASVNAICRMAVASTSHMVSDGVTMTFVQPENTEDLMLYTDRQRVEQILTNLLSNAAKFTSKGTIKLTYSIEAARKEIVFSVTDTGIGIPVEKSELIFDRFEKLNSYTQGAGLGLHICRMLARLLGGVVIVDKTYKKGARLLFMHPIRSHAEVITGKK